MLADVALLLPGPAAAPIPCDPERLGQKGAGLCAMSQLGLPVPPGLILPSALWPHFQAHGHFPDSFWQHVEAQLAEVEAVVGARLGDLDRPLLLSVRSGSRASMPGMMDIGAFCTSTRRWCWGCVRTACSSPIRSRCCCSSASRSAVCSTTKSCRSMT